MGERPPSSATGPGVETAVLGTLRLRVAAELVAAAGLAALLAWGAQRALGLPASATVQTLGIFLGVGCLAYLGLPAHLPHARFGAANRVTLLRAGLTAWLGGLLGQGVGAWGPGWAPVLAGAAILLLDGLDGRLARGRGTVSRYGARFDMEVDALLVLVLAGLTYELGRAGAWVLAAGLLRYLFVAAGRLWPWMRRPLFPSRRRQAVLVAQVASLLVALMPPVGSPWSDAVAGLGLTALVLSFARDTVWLLARRRSHDGEGHAR